jgi:signal transduction histidine kinase
MVSAARSSAEAADLGEGGTQTNLPQAFRVKHKRSLSVSPRDERFAELAISPEVREALRQAQKIEVMGHMAAGVAHDFNNMLYGVVGALDLMQTRVGQGRMDDLSDLLQTARISLRRTAALTHSLLAFWRPRPVELKAICVDTEIVSMESLLRCTIGDEIALEFALTSGLPSIVCDLHQLENALLNMVVNARDAMSHGGKIVIRTFWADYNAEETDPLGRRCVGICVADTGQGMPPDIAQHAFEPFYTTKPKGRGMGLGLTMIKYFIEQAGGQVKLKSSLGNGTTITLYLPAR